MLQPVIWQLQYKSIIKNDFNNKKYENNLTNLSSFQQINKNKKRIIDFVNSISRGLEVSQ